MANNIKTNPEQKIVKVNKQPTDNTKRENYYAKINLVAMSNAAIDLDAGAFKLWIYFAKNQDNYEFALSSKDAAENFGLKKKQYDNAVAQLIDKGYLNQIAGLKYSFCEAPVVSKDNNEEEKENSVVSKGYNSVVSKGYNVDVSKGNNVLYPKDTRNITDTTDNTTNITKESLTAKAVKSSETIPAAKGTQNNPIVKEEDWFIDKHNELITCANGLFLYQDIFYKRGGNENVI